MTIFALAFLPLLIGLGIWQLQRAAEKRAWETAWLNSMGDLPVTESDWLAGDGPEAFQRLRLRGAFGDRQHFLLDNRTRQGQPGYLVLSPFVSEAGRLYLVNRGWIAAPRARADLPEVPTPDGELTVIGTFWPDTGMLPLMGEDTWSGHWPRRIQRADYDRMLAALEGPLADVRPAAHDLELRLEAGQPGHLAPYGGGLDAGAPRHQGYALQWFGLALVLLIGYIYWGFRRDDTRSQH